MNIKELIESTNKVKNREQDKALKKKFGDIYAYNKRVTIQNNSRVVTISMLIGGATEFIKRGDKRVPIPFHKVSIAINVGESGRVEYTSDELVEAIRDEYSELRDDKEYPDADILTKAENNPSILTGWTVLKRTSGKGYVAIKNEISEDAPIQVWCSCSDYYWTFQYYNMQTPVEDAEGKSLGTLNLPVQSTAAYPKTYSYRSEKGKKSKRPLRNPGRHPGMCKHLMLLLAMLMKDKVVKEEGSSLGKTYEADFGKFLENKVKERLTPEDYKEKMRQYEAGHRTAVAQRNLIHYTSGNKTEREFQSESQELNIINESDFAKFNPITQERTFKNKGTFNKNTGKFKWEK